ncbi:MAG: enolase C-terminal domain-like protein [Alphaproteobacteria bacterium]
MALASIAVGRFPVPFRRPFTHAAATRDTADNIIVVATSDSGVVGFGEGCPRDYVTGESAATSRAFISSIASDLPEAARDLDALRHLVDARSSDIDRNPAAFCAVELALLDMIAHERGIGVEALLGQPPVHHLHRYTAVIGDTSPTASWWLWLRYRLLGLRDFKVKLSVDPARDRARLAPHGLLGGRLRLDANNLWRNVDDAVAHLRALHTPAFAIEEPLAPHDIAGCQLVASTAGIAIILDESFVSPATLAALPHGPRWIANVRVSKLGGVLRSLAAIDAARRHGIEIIVGAHVGETGLLTRAALPVARAAGPALVAQEGAFGTYLLRNDLASPSPRFGRGGWLPRRRLPGAGATGWGLTIDQTQLVDVYPVRLA